MSNIKKHWDKVPNWAKYTLYAVLGIAGAFLMGLLFGNLIMWLWNWLMPTIFGLSEITYWQAIGIFVLAKLIFGFGTSDHSESKSKKIKTPQCDDHSQAHWTEYESWWETEGKKSFEKYKDKGQETPAE